jgi:putative transposase
MTITLHTRAIADRRNIGKGRHCVFVMHVHLLVNFPPKVAVTKLVNSLKGVSSRRLRQEFPDLVCHYWRADKPWSGSYFAGTVGDAPLSVVRQYIEQRTGRCEQHPVTPGPALPTLRAAGKEVRYPAVM